MQPKEDRQFRLLKEFNFMCDCEACEKNYPCPPNLKFKDIKLLKFAKLAEDDILTLNSSQAMKKYRDCCDVIQKNQDNFPSIEMTLLQRCMAMYLLNQAKPSYLFP